MALIAVSGHPGCRYEEVARLAAQRLGYELLTPARISNLIEQEFGTDARLPERAWPAVVTSILARLATEHHLVFCALGGEVQARHFPGMLRVHVVAPESVRIGNLMVDHRLERAAARQMLLEMEATQRNERKARFGKSGTTADLFDVVLNSEALSSDQMAELVEASANSMGLKERGLLSGAAEAQLQFQIRLRLARYGFVPPANVTLRRKIFANQSEEIFANLLDFYRIAWEYEPRSFAIQWDREGRPTELFTPDFYLPESDLYVELTTMKQAHVTRKNRKVRLLRQIYPDVNIQVFYQKDFENLVFKYGLAGRPVTV